MPVTFHGFFCPHEAACHNYIYECVLANGMPAFCTSVWHNKNLGDRYHVDNNLRCIYMGEVQVINKLEKIDAELLVFKIKEDASAGQPSQNDCHPYRSLKFPAGTHKGSHLEN